MVQEADIEITNDSYLIIVYGQDKDKVKAREYDMPAKKSTENLLNNTMKSNIATVALAGFTSAIGQNIAGKALSNATLGRINSSIYDIMSDGKISRAEVAEDFIGSCTNAIDNAATDLGIPTPSSLYSALMPTGSGVISKDFTKFLAKNMYNETENEEQQDNNANITVLKFKNITSDTESWGIEIPTRKTESGFEIATAVSESNKTKQFEILLTTNERKGTDMYQIKNQLEILKKNKIPFDIYINDKDVYHQYKWTNCLFSNLDFAPNGTNALTCSMSVAELPEWDVKYIKLENYVSASNSYNKNNNVSGNSNSNSQRKSGIKNSKSSTSKSVKTKDKRAGGKIFPSEQSLADDLIRMKRLGYTNQQIYDSGLLPKKTYTLADVNRWDAQGFLTGKVTYGQEYNTNYYKGITGAY